MRSYEKDHDRNQNVCSRCGFVGHYAFEHATGTMEPFGTDRVVYSLAPNVGSITLITDEDPMMLRQSAIEAMQGYTGD